MKKSTEEMNPTTKIDISRRSLTKILLYIIFPIIILFAMANSYVLLCSIFDINP